jgi:DNA-binding beta-propeller fold protein YncE
MKNILIVCCMLFCSIVSIAQKHELVKLWETDTVLKVPESVLFDRDNNVLYVSNITGKGPWDKDGAGSVGKVATDGKIIAAEWVTGFNAPKGMGLYKGKLYVADLSELVVVDIATGAVEKRIPVQDALGLNDVTISPDGSIYVSDSRTKKVFRVENGIATVHIDKLQGPNGVLYHDNTLYVLDNGGLFSVNADRSLQGITAGMEGGTDGLENIKGKDFIVSCWAGAIWYVSEDGSKELLLDTRQQKRNTADIGIDAKKRIIYVPTFWKNSIEAYEVKDR